MMAEGGRRPGDAASEQRRVAILVDKVDWHARRLMTAFAARMAAQSVTNQ